MDFGLYDIFEQNQLIKCLSETKFTQEHFGLLLDLPSCFILPVFLRLFDGTLTDPLSHLVSHLLHGC
jgi:hypothetical protein